MGIFSGPSYANPTGAAGGDLTGTYPSPTVGALKITNAKVSASAAIDYSKLTLTSGIVNADVSASAAIALAKLADPTTGKVLGSTSNAAAAVFPPGFELGYSEITTGVDVVSTTEASSTTIITSAAIAFDGAPVICEFFAPSVSTGTGSTLLVVISLFEGATQIGRIAVVRAVNVSSNSLIPVRAVRRFTPSAATHTYIIAAFATATTGTPSIGAGAGGTATQLPAFVRFTKV